MSDPSIEDNPDIDERSVPLTPDEVGDEQEYEDTTDDDDLDETDADDAAESGAGPES